jgi:hypothetical protein
MVNAGIDFMGECKDLRVRSEMWVRSDLICAAEIRLVNKAGVGSAQIGAAGGRN